MAKQKLTERITFMCTPLEAHELRAAFEAHPTIRSQSEFIRHTLREALAAVPAATEARAAVRGRQETLAKAVEEAYLRREAVLEKASNEHGLTFFRGLDNRGVPRGPAHAIELDIAGRPIWIDARRCKVSHDDLPASLRAFVEANIDALLSDDAMVTGL